MEADRRPHRRRAAPRGERPEPDASRRSTSRRPGSSASPALAAKALDPSARLVPDWRQSSSRHVRSPLPRRVARGGLLRADHRHPRRRRARLPRARQHRAKAPGRRSAARGEPGRHAQGAGRRRYERGCRRSRLREATVQERDGEQAEGEEGRRAVHRFVGQGSPFCDHVSPGRRRRRLAAPNPVREGSSRSRCSGAEAGEQALARQVRRPGSATEPRP